MTGAANALSALGKAAALCVVADVPLACAVKAVHNVYAVTPAPVAYAPLVWNTFCSRTGNCSAKTILGEYVVQLENGSFAIYRPGDEKSVVDAVTIRLAREWVWDHYLDKLRSAQA